MFNNKQKKVLNAKLDFVLKKWNWFQDCSEFGHILTKTHSAESNFTELMIMKFKNIEHK